MAADRNSDAVRSSGLTGYTTLVTRLGGDPAQFLRRARIPMAALDSDDTVISFRAVIGLLEFTAMELECPDFGMQLAQMQDLRILGPIRTIGLNSATVGDAFHRMIEHLAFYSPVVICNLDDSTDPRRPRFTYDVAITGVAHRRQLYELAIGLLVRHMHALTGGHFTPVAVMFRHTSKTPKTVYRRYLGVRPLFGQAVTALVVRPDDLKRPLENGDPQLRRVFEDYVRQSTLTCPLEIQRQVEHLVRRALPSGRCSLPAIATQLFLHERTLQRRLTQNGGTFEDIVDSVRRERLEELLSESRLTMSQVASQLGYAKQSSFNRACRRWFGSTPRALRSLIES
jgi:AraC-like DNA-binding protein